MASSRLEKVGTIYSRAQALLKSGAVQWNDRPLWYDIYEAFPPKDEPKFARPIPNMPLQKIFYEEDKIRALFHKHNKQIGSINMFNNNYQTITQRFINCYKKLETQYKDEEIDQEKLYKEAISLLQKEREISNRQQEISGELEENVSLSEAFKKAQKPNQDDESKGKQNLDLKVSDIFKD